MLAEDLTGRGTAARGRSSTRWPGLGIDTIETVLLYHVVPGATITPRPLSVRRGGADHRPPGATVTVDVSTRSWLSRPAAGPGPATTIDPFLEPPALDINKGNKQIAHGIVLVLRPVDL